MRPTEHQRYIVTRPMYTVYKFCAQCRKSGLYLANLGVDLVTALSQLVLSLLALLVCQAVIGLALDLLLIIDAPLHVCTLLLKTLDKPWCS